MTNNSTQKRLIFLDFLRIFAFSSVLIGHKFYQSLVDLANNNSIHASIRLIINAILPFFYAGGAGVIVFFLISGYIVIHVLQTTSSVDFIIKRIFRIYPLYIFAVLLQYSISAILHHNYADFKTLIPQLLLIGDFFNTPYTLNGVEWTLRIEILFYFYMFFMDYLQLTKKYKSILPFILIITVIIIGQIGTFPTKLFSGYFNLYAPLLFLGTLFWLYENKFISNWFMFFYTAIILIQYWHLIATIAPTWRFQHFCLLAIILFSLVWRFREKFIFNRTVLFISELTYAVYLTHNWLFDYIKHSLDVINISYSNLLALGILILFCIFMVRIIEKPGIKLGNQIVKRFKNYRANFVIYPKFSN